MILFNVENSLLVMVNTLLKFLIAAFIVYLLETHNFWPY